MDRRELRRLRERSILRVTQACDELYELIKKDPARPMWASKMGPCNKWERDLVKELVSEQLTYDASLYRFDPYRVWTR